MKVALLAFLGLFLGALGGAALGIGAGLAWVELFKTTSFEGYSGMLVFFTFRDGRLAQIREIIDSYDLVQQVLERDLGPLIISETAEDA